MLSGIVAIQDRNSVQSMSIQDCNARCSIRVNTLGEEIQT